MHQSSSQEACQCFAKRLKLVRQLGTNAAWGTVLTCWLARDIQQLPFTLQSNCASCDQMSLVNSLILPSMHVTAHAQVRHSPVHLEHKVGWEVGYSAEALGLSFVASSCTKVIRHDFLPSPFGQAGSEGHLGQHHFLTPTVLHMHQPMLSNCRSGTAYSAEAVRVLYQHQPTAVRKEGKSF